MDLIRNMSVVSIAHLVVLGALGPALAETNEDETEHRRLTGRRHVQTISHERADYPVIWNWLSAPEPSDSAK